jgi:phage repressor protein C with HTH and peptisase S24 domain
MAQARKRLPYRETNYPVPVSNLDGKQEKVVDLVRAARLRQARIAAGFARAADAILAFGWKESTYWSHENGTRGISRDRLLLYANSFRVRADWLAFGAGSGEPVARTKQTIIEGYMTALAKIVERTSAEHDVSSKIEETDLPSTIADDLRAFRVIGNANYPAFHDGDVIFVSRAPGSPENFLNRECLVTTVDGEKFIRRILQGSQAGRFVLIGFNTPPLIDIEVSAAAPVEWIHRGS